MPTAPRFTKVLAWLSFGISCFALLASYGYPNFMTPFWYFGILPFLATITCIISSIGLGLSSVSKQKFSSLPLLVTFGLIGVFAVAMYALSNISVTYLWDVIPRIGFALLGGAIAYCMAAIIHGSTNRKRMVVVNSMAIFQAATSVADMMSLSTTQ